MSRAIIVAGLGFGDEGKGTTVERLVARERSSLVVRYNGGPQAAHNVVRDDGKHHTFSQVGSGFFEGARTFLSRFMLVNPLSLGWEMEHLRSFGFGDFKEKLFVDRECPIVTPFHKIVNRMKEKSRGKSSHGSCGMGVGEAFEDARDYPDLVPRIGDLDNPKKLRRKMDFIQDLQRTKISALKVEREDLEKDSSFRDLSQIIEDEADRYVSVLCGFDGELFTIVDRSWLDSQFNETPVIFEGAQGVLLDMNHGFNPHTTWSDCTFGNALELLNEITSDIEGIGVTRTYHTRHGNGPFPSEERLLNLEERHNETGRFQGSFRTGHLDLVLLKYASRILNSQIPFKVSLTHMDRLENGLKACKYKSLADFLCSQWNWPERAFNLTDQMNSIEPSDLSFIDLDRENVKDIIEEATGGKVVIESWGPCLSNKVDCRG